MVKARRKERERVTNVKRRVRRMEKRLVVVGSSLWLLVVPLARPLDERRAMVYDLQCDEFRRLLASQVVQCQRAMATNNDAQIELLCSSPILITATQSSEMVHL